MNWGIAMSERKYDRSLRIQTLGIRELEEANHNRYEATPYVALDKLVEEYKINETDKLVDFGCGRGRSMFYFHHHFHIPVTGIEADDKTFDEALDNKASYRHEAGHIEAPIYFEYGLAENYELNKEDNLFYFFNPFSLTIFKKIVENILQSVKAHPRTVDIIFYYPLNEFMQFLQKDTPFELITQINVPGIHGEHGKFAIYRTS